MRGFGSVTLVCWMSGCVLVFGSDRLSAQSTAADPKLAAPIFTGLRLRQVGADPSDDEAAKRKQRIIWGSILAGMVGATVLGDWANGGIDFPEAAIPVAGPFIALARYDDVVTSPFYQGRAADKVLFAASGVVQAISLIFIIKSLRGAPEELPSRKHVPVISLVPLGPHGFLVSSRLRLRAP